MFVTDKLVFLELQKTATTCIASLINKCVGGEQVGKHNTLQNYDTQKVVVGSVRNPWHWYVSLWAFGRGREGRLYERLTRRTFSRHPCRLVGFNIRQALKPLEQWKEAYHDEEEARGFRCWLRMILDPKRKWDIQEGYPESSISRFADLMTFRYCRIYVKHCYPTIKKRGLSSVEDLQNFVEENRLLDGVIRVEHLEEDLIRALKAAGYTVDEQVIREGGARRINTSSHKEPAAYYDEQTIALVRAKERFIVDAYSYDGP